MTHAIDGFKRKRAPHKASVSPCDSSTRDFATTPTVANRQLRPAYIILLFNSYLQMQVGTGDSTTPNTNRGHIAKEVRVKSGRPGAKPPRSARLVLRTEANEHSDTVPVRGSKQKL